LSSPSQNLGPDTVEEIVRTLGPHFTGDACEVAHCCAGAGRALLCSMLTLQSRLAGELVRDFGPVFVAEVCGWGGLQVRRGRCAACERLVKELVISSTQPHRLSSWLHSVHP
jgi:hypothetical protein